MLGLIVRKNWWMKERSIIMVLQIFRKVLLISNYGNYQGFEFEYIQKTQLLECLISNDNYSNACSSNNYLLLFGNNNNTCYLSML